MRLGVAAEVLAACTIAAAPSIALAHPITFTDTTLTLERDGTFQVDVIYDLDALALGASITVDDAELVAALDAMSADEFEETVGRLRRLFERRVRVRFDGTPAPFEVDFSDYGTTRALEAEIPTVLGLTARLTGQVPAEASTVEFFASRAFADVHLTIVDRIVGAETRAILERGARSDPYGLGIPPEPPTRGQIASQYLGLGFRHIVPDGLDHVAFVLGLFLLSARLRPLVWQVTAFTVAHAVTLTAATFGLVTLSPDIVEPLIALSVAYVAIENILTDRLTIWRPPIVFGFGLLHGLGFAGALGTLGLPDGERLLALVTFNVGIELGQLAVIAAAAATVGWFRHRPWYRRRVVIPASATIGLVGLVWAMERVLA